MNNIIEVDINSIEVFDRYYSFDYEVYLNNKLVEEDSYNSDHSRVEDKEAFKKELEEGYATILVLERVIYEIF